MADRKISDLTALTTPASGDYVPIVDISEGAAASKNKRVTIQSLFQGIPVNVGIGASSPQSLLHLEGGTATQNLIASSGNAIFRMADSVTSGTRKEFTITLDNTNNRVDIQAVQQGVATRNITLNAGGGNVGIGTTSPGEKLTIAGTSGSAAISLLETGVRNWAIRAGGALTNTLDVADLTAGATRLAIDSSGRLLVGTSTARSNFFNTSYTPQLQLEGVGQPQSMFSLVNSVADNGGPVIALGKQRSGTIGGNTILQSGDQIGELTYQGSDGTEFVAAASITAYVDGTPGANDMPGRLMFSTTADGASSPTERMRISQNGNAYIGTTADLVSDTNRLHVSGTRAIVGRATGGATIPVITSWNDATSGDNIFVSFRTETADTQRGTIDYNRAGGQVRYNVTSDSRLKSEIQPAASALDNLAAIQVRAYKWTETDYQINYGFVAQELNEVAPDAVKEGDYGEEITNVWAVDNSKLVPLLTKALQEAIARIETLEAAVAALQGA